MSLMYTRLSILSVLIWWPKVGLLHNEQISIVRILSKGEIVNSKSEEDNLLSSGGILLPISDCCRCVTFGGSSVIGRLFMPLSNLACLAIFICSVSRSDQRMLRVVLGMKPRNIPLRELFQNLAVHGV